MLNVTLFVMFVSVINLITYSPNFFPFMINAAPLHTTSRACVLFSFGVGWGGGLVEYS